MDTSNFAEIRKKFNEISLTKASATKGTTNNNDMTSDSTIKTKSNSNQLINGSNESKTSLVKSSLYTNDAIHPDSSNDTTISNIHRMLPSDTTNFASKPSVAPLTIPVQTNLYENTKIETVPNSQDSGYLNSKLKSNTSCISKPIVIDENESLKSTSLFSSLNEALPLKCMFHELENVFNEYQKRDPHTIFYPRTKPTMPKVTKTEINLVERYSIT